MRILLLALIFFSSLANAEGFFSGEPDKKDLEGAIYRALYTSEVIKQYGELSKTFQIIKFQKIDCLKQSPKIFRCTFLIQFSIPGIFNETVTDSNIFTKLNGQWTVLGPL